MVWRAADSGADYAKIQTIFAEDITRRERFEEGFRDRTTNSLMKRPYAAEYARLKPLELDKKGHEVFLSECQAYGIKPLTTVFTRSRIPFAYDLGFKEIKVGSADCSSFPMIMELRERFEHIYVSTGMTFDHEVQQTARILSGSSFSLLHCVSVYPTPLEDLNLARISRLLRLAKEVGFSDHTLVEKDGLKAAAAALLLNAQVIERHFTIVDRSVTKDGPVSINPRELKELVEISRMSKEELRKYVNLQVPELNLMIGVEDKTPSDEELRNRDYYRGRFASRVNGNMIYNWEDRQVL